MKTFIGDFLSDVGNLAGRFFKAIGNFLCDGDLVVYSLVTSFLFSLILGALALAFNSVMASGQVTYCTIENEWVQSFAAHEQVFKIIGHKEYRADIRIATMPNLNLALAFLDTDACHSKTTQSE